MFFTIETAKTYASWGFDISGFVPAVITADQYKDITGKEYKEVPTTSDDAK